tara:strand:+ start:632 stop:1027 length:396 start_codon:yes stop_codon:yes gene_type:complete
LALVEIMPLIKYIRLDKVVHHLLEHQSLLVAVDMVALERLHHSNLVVLVLNMADLAAVVLLVIQGVLLELTPTLIQEKLMLQIQELVDLDTQELQEQQEAIIMVLVEVVLAVLVLLTLLVVLVQDIRFMLA